MASSYWVGVMYDKVGQLAGRAAMCYYKVEQELLQSGADLVLEIGTTLLKNGLSIIKWENYYKVDQCKIQNLNLNYCVTTLLEILKILELYLIFKHYFFEA